MAHGRLSVGERPVDRKGVIRLQVSFDDVAFVSVTEGNVSDLDQAGIVGLA